VRSSRTPFRCPAEAREVIQLAWLVEALRICYYEDSNPLAGRPGKALHIKKDGVMEFRGKRPERA
jgi:hypothetical protein